MIGLIVALSMYCSKRTIFQNDDGVLSDFRARRRLARGDARLRPATRRRNKPPTRNARGSARLLAARGLRRDRAGDGIL
jgi:hypothetical protein